MALHYHNPDPPSGYSPEEGVKALFGANLQRAMVRAGMTQSDLARAAARHMKDGKFSRDLVSKYVRGMTLPRPDHLAALCSALSLERGDLLPEKGVPHAGMKNPPLDLRAIDAANVWLRINQAMPLGKALETMKLLKE